MQVEMKMAPDHEQINGELGCPDVILRSEKSQVENRVCIGTFYDKKTCIL